MKSKNQSIAVGFVAGIAFYAIPFVARSLSNFVVVPIYTRYLTPADYGVLELLDLTSFLVATLIGTNFGQSLFYYHAAARSPKDRGEAVSTTFYGSLILAGISIVFGVGLAAPLGRLLFGNSDYTSFLRLVFGTLAFAFPAEVGLSCLRALERIRAYSMISVARLILGAVLNVILLIKYHLGFAALLWGSFWVTAATAVFLAWFNRHWLRYSFHWGLFIKLMKYSWPLNISGLATLALDLGDRYVLKRWVSLSDLGIYGLAYKFGMIVSMASLIFNQFWKPKMYTLVKEPGGERYYVRICTYYVLALMFVAIGLSVPVPALLRVGVGASFLPALKYIPWIASIYVVRLLADFSRNAFFLNKRTGKEAQITWLAAAICIAGYLGFIPVLKLWGAILATGISFLVMFVVSFWQAQKVQHFDFEYGRLAAIGGCGAGLIVAYSLIEPASIVMRLLLSTVVTLAFPVLLYLGGFFREDERAWIAGLLHSARTKMRSAVTVEG